MQRRRERPGAPARIATTTITGCADRSVTRRAIDGSPLRSAATVRVKAYRATGQETLTLSDGGSPFGVCCRYFLMTHQFAAPQTGSVADRQPGVLETLELRWFAPGRIPAAAVTWFEATAPHVVVEERIDSYLLTGRPDLGVKRRNHGPLQVKERRRIGTSIPVGGHLVGRVEEWHKSTQALSPAAGERWLDVDKHVLTFSYRAAGTGGLATACDIELAAVETDCLEAWTLAFEASGPPTDRLGTLRSSVERFLSDTDVPAAIAAALELEAGYPAWLLTVAGA